MDIDYNVIENTRSRLRHLVINALGATTTVCGLSLGLKTLVDSDMPTKKFWKSAFSCKNCKRAAKH